jgi:hypothetical protein
MDVHTCDHPACSCQLTAAERFCGPAARKRPKTWRRTIRASANTRNAPRTPEVTSVSARWTCNLSPVVCRIVQRAADTPAPTVQASARQWLA